MTTCAPLRMACNCGFSPRPPTTTAARMPLPAAILPKASAIWMASSRVGLRIMARIPARCGSVLSNWISGRTNARVFPVPVCAVATRSRPASAGSIARACTGVGSVKPCFLRLLFKRAERESSEKLFIDCSCVCEKRNQRADCRGWKRGLRINFNYLSIVANAAPSCPVAFLLDFLLDV